MPSRKEFELFSSSSWPVHEITRGLVKNANFSVSFPLIISVMFKKCCAARVVTSCPWLTQKGKVSSFVIFFFQSVINTPRAQRDSMEKKTPSPWLRLVCGGGLICYAVYGSLCTQWRKCFPVGLFSLFLRRLLFTRSNLASEAWRIIAKIRVRDLWWWSSPTKKRTWLFITIFFFSQILFVFFSRLAGQERGGMPMASRWPFRIPVSRKEREREK